MVTYFLGGEEVAAYLRDFLERLSKFDPIPTVWCPMTPSGNELLDALLDLVSESFPDLVEKVSVLPIQIDEKTDRIKFDAKNPSKIISGKSVLIFDGAIHSGSTISRSVSKAVEYGAAEVCTYALVVKQRSIFIPTLWGVMIAETDRVFFLLDRIPNQRLQASGKRKPPFVHIQKLNDKHGTKPPVKCGVKSLDRVTWGDRLFDMATGEQDRCSYVLERRDGILGYLTVHNTGPDCLAIDEVALSKDQQGKHLGGILLRFADTLARQSDCRFVRLHAIKKQISFYERFGYQLISQSAVRLDKEEYWPMERPLLHTPVLPVVKN